MAARRLTRLTVEPGPDGVLALAAELPDAISGAGPAIAPIPQGPPGYVDRVLQAVRPDDDLAPLEHDDVAVVVATSGSMGQPRGVLIPGSALIASAKATDSRLGGPARWVLALPVHHVAGLQVLVRAHLSGVHPIALDTVGGAGSFSAEEFALTSRAARGMADTDGAPLRTALVPTQLARIMELGSVGIEALAGYDTVLLGGAAAPAGLVGRARQLGANIVTTYGMTETAGGCVYDGVPLAGVAVNIVDPDSEGVGRIELCGPMAAWGYRLRQDLTNEAFSPGMHRTQDVGRLTAENKLEVLGRIDDIVQVGGINVSVAAVEAVMQSHPSVAEVAVVSVPDSDWGSRLAVFVVASPNSEVSIDALPGAVADLTINALGTEARPRQVDIVSSLPTLPSGKVDRQELRKLVSGH